MIQFDILKNKNTKSAQEVPFLINLQSNPMAPLATRIVAPIRKESDYADQKLTRIHISVKINGENYIAFISELAAVPSSLLGEKVGNAAAQREMFTSAVDLLFTGF